MIIITGGAGFIGSRLILGLNRLGYQDILVVDDLTDGRKFKNLTKARISDYIDYEKFLNIIESNKVAFPSIEAVFHQGACTKTTEWDGRYMMANNYDYSKKLLHYCLDHHVPFIYASSAAVYGANMTFKEKLENEKPLNVYGYSKYLFDQYVRRQLPKINSPVIGLRYFNVYGPHEDFKGGMASVVWHLMNQLKDTEEVRLFQGSDGYQPGEQKRDFIFVDDVVNVNLWFLKNPMKTGIYNCGTGKARSFNTIARTLLKLYGKGTLKYIPFPEHLKGYYQSFTQADISKLRDAGYSGSFISLEEGIKRYYEYFSDDST
jgi:ADP-L-glycero-D-manno-heptose 6-epimerase